MNLALVIPTLNRINELTKLVNSIKSQVIPKRLNVTVCISGAYCNSEVKKYLKSIEGKNRRLLFKINNEPIGLANWYLAASLVPVDCDFAWTIGDDDEFVSTRSISRIFHLLNTHPEIDGLFIPMASKVNDEYFIKDNFYDICNRVGFHEIVGWISSSIIRGVIFKDIYLKYRQVFLEKKISFNHASKLARSLYEKKIGQFTHATCILEALFASQVIFASFQIIKEQNSPRGLLETLRRDKIALKNKKYHSVRFIFDLLKISQILVKNDRTPSPVFYRYVSRDYFQLCYDILLDGISTNSYGTGEVDHLFEILNSAIISDDISYVKFNKITVQFIEFLYSASKRDGRRATNTDFQDLLKLIKMREYIKI